VKRRSEVRIVGLSLRASTTISRINLQLTYDRLGHHWKHLDQKCAAMHSLLGAWTDPPGPFPRDQPVHPSKCLQHAFSAFPVVLPYVPRYIIPAHIRLTGESIIIHPVGVWSKNCMLGRQNSKKSREHIGIMRLSRKENMN
jgi:hypothetical protein